MSTPTRRPDRAEVLADLAAAAGIAPEQIEADEDFLGLGIDSVRLMRLVDGWQARGATVRFPDLAACATVGDALDAVAA